MNEAAWIPDSKTVNGIRLTQWIKELGLTDYDEFYQKSIEDPEWFWKAVEQELGIVWRKPYQSVLDLSKGIAHPNWYVNGTCNIIDTCLQKRNESNQPAILYENEEGLTREYSYKQLNNWVNQVARGLQKQGITKGDRITIYMPMIPETIVAMLASIKIGAIVSPIFSGFAEDALKTRVNAAGSKMIITASHFTRRGKQVSLCENVSRALPVMKTVKSVVVAGLEEPDDLFHPWSCLEGEESNIDAEEMEADEPLMLIYTSGTTGKPKGTVHTHTGFPIKAAIDARIAMDLVEGDRLLWITDMGWMMGPFLLFSSFMNGATIVMYDGVPDYPEPDRIWKMVEKWKITQLGISPTLIRSLMAMGDGWLANHDLSSLKVFASTGEPWNPGPWNWLFEKVGNSQIPIINYSGGTEIAGGILGNVLVKPISPITFNTPMPGMSVAILNEHGQSVMDEVGELCISTPWVGMTKGFWMEPERYLNTYWDRFENLWVHGDWVETDGQFYEIKGRSDDTLNIAGKRVGPTEYESILVKHDDVVEAAAIGIPDERKGEACICFAVLRDNVNGSSELEEELTDLLCNQLGKALKPSAIYFISDLPKTRNQKIMRRVIKNAYLHNDEGDLSSLINPEVVEEIRRFINV